MHGSSSDQNGCPTSHQLSDFDLGKLPSRKIDQIGKHLAGCDDCQTALRQLDDASDPLVDYLRDSKKRAREDSGWQSLRTSLHELPSRILGPYFEASDSSTGDQDDETFIHRPIPRRLGQYRLLERISQGAMGIVFRGWHVKLKQYVAIKLLLPKSLDDERAVKRFYREMEVLGQLDAHPHIVRARDAAEDKGFHYLVMDYIDGIDLSGLLSRLGKLRTADACEIVRQAALGIDHAYQHEIVHRDVKPGNLMLTRSGQVNVLDLGLAAMLKHVEQGDLESDVVAGTADYMAPEQWLGADDVDTRADIYGLGCTLFKLLVGHAPYGPGKDSSRAKMKAHVRATIPSICSIRPTIPTELDAIVQRMLAKNPSKRYARPREVAEALSPFVGDSDLRGLVSQADLPMSDTSGRTDDLTLAVRSAYESMRRYSKRRRSFLVAAAVAGILFCAAGIWGFAWAWFPKIELVFASQQQQTMWKYDFRRDQFQVQADDRALFKFNKAESDNYSISTQIGQTDWQGEAGLYFDHRIRERDADKTHCAQLIWLRPNFSSHPDGSYDLCRSVLRIRELSDERRDRRRTDLASVPVSVASNRLSNSLQIDVNCGQIERVLWNGNMLPELADEGDSFSYGLKNLAALGNFGFYMKTGMTKFQSTQLQ